MIARLLSNLVRERLGQFPAVGLIGPRQSGKTTLAKQFSTRYFDLEQASERLRLDLGWEELICSDELLVLDEAQTWPEIFPRIRGAIDARRDVRGRFLLLGSVSPELMKNVGESLAGRLALLELPPLLAAELSPEFNDRLWRCGGYPEGGVIEETLFPIWQANYLQILARQDLPTWGLAAKPAEIERLFRLTASLNGSILNYSEIGRHLGLSYHTVQDYLDYLEGVFLIRRLQPFHANNISKRLIKSPKIYWRDTGLLHSLLGVGERSDLLSQPWHGMSWEAWLIEQIISTRRSRGETLDAYFFRSSDGLECDLIVESSGEREVIEFKMTSAPAPRDFHKLEKIARLVGAKRQVLISRVGQSVEPSGERWSVNIDGYFRALGVIRPSYNSLTLPLTALTVPLIYQKLKESQGKLVEHGILREETLLRRAQFLKADIDALQLRSFEILPSEYLPVPALGAYLPFIQYRFDTPNFSPHKADDPFHVKKHSREMGGTGLDREDLACFAAISEIGHTVIPHLWPSFPEPESSSPEVKKSRMALEKNLRNPAEHLNTLNEVWWLKCWEGLDKASVYYEHICDRTAMRPGKNPSTADWSFTTLSGQVRINLEVKNRPGTHGARVYGKPFYLFSNEPEQPFGESSENEINVLAVTAYLADSVSDEALDTHVEEYFASLEERKRPVVDAVLVWMPLGGSPSSSWVQYFPKNRDLKKKDLILKALLREPSEEDRSRFGLQQFPISLDEAIPEAETTLSGS